MTASSVVEEAEHHLRRLAAELTGPHPDECLFCYVYRMLEYGCTGFRWVRRYRDLRAPRATALEERLGRVGGYCDCEVFLNGFELAPQHWVPRQGYVEDGITYETDPSYPDPMPTCRGVGRGSTKGCTLWTRQWRR